MTTFYICRHGETENNKNQRLSGWVDTPLTKEGIKNALSSASKLKGLNFDAIVSSDLGRAFTTANIIVNELGINVPILRDINLREMNYGDLANLPYSSYPALRINEKTDYIPPNGESLNSMRQRVMKQIHELSFDYPDQTILIVAHDGTINAIRSSYSGENMGIADSTHNAHDSVNIFTYSGGVKSYELYK